MSKPVHIGYGHYVPREAVVSILAYNSLTDNMRKSQLDIHSEHVLDLSGGHKKLSVLVLSSGMRLIVSKTPETLIKRFSEKNENCLL